MDGAILPFGNYKGSGLAMMIDILAGGLTGSHMGKSLGSWGNLVIAINPEIFVDKNDFQSNVSKLIDDMKNSRKADGFSEVLVPREMSEKKRENHLKEGFLEIDDKIIDGIKKWPKVI